MLRIIGDIHGRIGAYRDTIRHYRHSVQLGDMGFRSHYKILQFARIDPAHHVIIPGNHDDYRHLPPHALDTYGHRSMGDIDFFWVRGAESIDRNLRIIGESWWPEEEIPYPEGPYALNLYCETKPQIVLTHDCPTSILPHVLRGPYKGRHSRTNELLQQMFDMHQPALWFFGHHHRSVTASVHGTTFRCLDELETYDLLADA